MVKKFAQQTKEVVMCDAVAIDNLRVVSGVSKKNDLVVVGLQEWDAIAVKRMQGIEDDYNTEVVVVEGNEGMLEQQAIEEFYWSLVMVIKWEDGEEVSTIRHDISTIWENKFEVVNPIK